MDLAGLDPAEGGPDDLLRDFYGPTKYSNENPGEDDFLNALMDCMEDVTRAAGAATAANFDPEVVLDYVRSVTALDREVIVPEKQLPLNGKHILDLSIETIDGDDLPFLTPLIPARSSDPGLLTKTTNKPRSSSKDDFSTPIPVAPKWGPHGQPVITPLSRSNIHADKASQTSSTSLDITASVATSPTPCSKDRCVDKASQTSETALDTTTGVIEESREEIFSRSAKSRVDETECSGTSGSDPTGSDLGETSNGISERTASATHSGGAVESSNDTAASSSEATGGSHTYSRVCRRGYDTSAATTATNDAGLSLSERGSRSRLEECVKDDILLQIGNENINLLTVTSSLNPQGASTVPALVDPLYGLQDIQTTLLASYCSMMDGEHSATEASKEEASGRGTTSEQVPGDTSSFSHTEEAFGLEFPANTVDELSVFHQESMDRSQSVHIPCHTTSTDILVDIQPRMDLGQLIASHQVQENPFQSSFLSMFEPAVDVPPPGQEPLLKFSGSTLHHSVDEKSFINFLFSNISNETPDGEVQLKSFHDIDSNLYQMDSADVLFQRRSQNAFDPVFTSGPHFEATDPIRPAEEVSFFYDPESAHFEMVDANNNVLEDPKTFVELTTIEEADRVAEIAEEIEGGFASSARSSSGEIGVAFPVHERASKETVPPQQCQTAPQGNVLNVFPVHVFNPVPDFLRSQKPLYEKNVESKDMGEEGEMTADSGQTLLRLESDIFGRQDGTEPERNYDVLRHRRSGEGLLRKVKSPSSDPASTRDSSVRIRCSSSGSSSSTEEGEIRPTSRRRNLRRILQSECKRRFGEAKQEQLPLLKSKITERATVPFQDSGPETWPLDCHTSHTTTKSRYFGVDKYDLDTEDLAAGFTEDAAILGPLLASEHENDIDGDSLLGVTESVLTGQAALLKNVLMRFASSDEDPNSNAGPEVLALTRATKFVSLPHRRPVYQAPETQQVFNETGLMFGTPQPAPPQLGRGLHSEVPMSFVEEDIRLNSDSPLFGTLDEFRNAGGPRDMDSRREMFPPCLRGYGGRLEQEFELVGFDEMHPRPIKSSLKPVLPKISEEQME